MKMKMIIILIKFVNELAVIRVVGFLED